MRYIIDSAVFSHLGERPGGLFYAALAVMALAAALLAQDEIN